MNAVLAAGLQSLRRQEHPARRHHSVSAEKCPKQFIFEIQTSKNGRKESHQVFATNICSDPNPWPLPLSIVIPENAKIHVYEEL
ncbi:hypothetical protein PPTG_21377 [Phytophthora nicotianae INRA-310]|uniref:Uncharacterized protein n=1 Tax=Phytophthora nicotianae (strain INRA-310) TaxID=761204 RepID=W2R0R6_PHYN3|nr:hypothetical protein PPTG_21377 [Phytophthora nicotianae INRA-310]ETN18948.1 hypothetical protein PPTG_21377 [Phytophthora nicotianae INRA-310]